MIGLWRSQLGFIWPEMTVSPLYVLVLDDKELFVDLRIRPMLLRPVSSAMINKGYAMNLTKAASIQQRTRSDLFFDCLTKDPKDSESLTRVKTVDDEHQTQSVVG